MNTNKVQLHTTQHTHIFMSRNAYNILCFFIRQVKIQYIGTKKVMYARNLTCSKHTLISLLVLSRFFCHFSPNLMLMPILFVLLCTPFFRLTDRKAIMLQYILFDNGSSEWGEKFTRKKNTEHGKFSFDCISFALSRCLEMLCMCVCVLSVFMWAGKRNSIFLVNSLIDFGCWIGYASSLSLNNNKNGGGDDDVDDECDCVPTMYATASI